MCIDCKAKLPSVKRAKKQCAQRLISTESRGRKRRVLGDTDPNVQRKAPRLAPNEPVRWDMASQHTKERMRSKAAIDETTASHLYQPTPLEWTFQRSLPFHYPPERHHLLRRLLLHTKLLYQTRSGRISMHSTSI
jgi:hypothetical protein